MQVHITNTGAVRVGMSRRNVQRLIDYADRDPLTTLGVESGDVYLDGTPIMGHLIAGIANENTDSTELQCVSPVGAVNVLRLSCPHAWLTEQSRLIDAGERPESVLENGIIVYTESDELHYEHRAPGYGANTPLPEPSPPQSEESP